MHIILLRDVSLSVGESRTSTSGLNVLVGTVVDSRQALRDRHAVDVKPDVGCPLLARVTKKSFTQLALSPGQHVLAYVKTVALSEDFQA